MLTVRLTESALKQKNLKQEWLLAYSVGSGVSSVVRASDSWMKGPGFQSLREWWENFLLQGQLPVLTLIAVSISLPCYRSSTKKDPRHSAKSAGSRLHINMHAHDVCGFAWSDTAHGCTVYAEHAKTTAVSCGTSFGRCSKMHYKTLVTQCRITCKHRGSAWEQRIALYIKSDQQHRRFKRIPIYYHKIQRGKFQGKPTFSSYKQQLHGEKWDVGYVSAFAFGWALFVLLVSSVL